MVALNQYQNLVETASDISELSGTAKTVYEGAVPSLKAKNMAASLYTEENQNYAMYLERGKPDSREVYNVLAKRTNQVRARLKNSIDSNLEGILRDAQLVREGLVEFAAENVKPVRTGNKAHNAIADAHKTYNEARELMQNYELEINRKRKGEEKVGNKAKDAILDKIYAVYDEMYTEKEEENKILMKEITDFVGEILITDYDKIVKQAKEDFMSKLKGNEVSYLTKNANSLVDKNGLIGYLVSGDETQLVKSAQENGDSTGAQAIHQEIRQNRMAEEVHSSPTQARGLTLRTYEGTQPGEGLALSREQASTPSILRQAA
jgi:hypothetical protein